MQLAMIGLGRMGSNMVLRLMEGGHELVVFDKNAAAAADLVKQGAGAARTLADLAGKLARPRAVWVMVPAGDATEDTILALANVLDRGDMIIDGGNSYFKDDVRRAAILKEKGIHLIDCGTSGGVWGRERGYCLTIGGEVEIVRHLDPVFKTLAPGAQDIPQTPGRNADPDTAALGYLHVGPVGSGHFVKMIHNGIEYGLMQAYAEGFEILRHASNSDLPEKFKYDISLEDVAEVWRRGSVIQSWLLDLSAMALAEDPSLSSFTGYVEDSGEGRWTIQAAIEEAVPAEVLSAALYTRFRSRQENPFSERLLSAMRYKFGGHAELKKNVKPPKAAAPSR